MLDLFTSVKNLLKIDQVCIDNNTFRLHYKATVILLFICSIMVTAKQYFGEPITCIMDNKDLQKVMDTYCWIESTFTMPNRLIGKVGKDFAHAGIGLSHDHTERKYHKYYQWVCFMLFFQGTFNF